MIRQLQDMQLCQHAMLLFIQYNYVAAQPEHLVRYYADQLPVFSPGYFVHRKVQQSSSSCCQCSEPISSYVDVVSTLVSAVFE